MLTYIGLVLAAIYVLYRWRKFHKSKQGEHSLRALDEQFKVLLNKGDSHES